MTKNKGNAAIVALAKEFRALRDTKDRLEAELSACNASLKKIAEDKLPTMLDDNDVENIKIDGVGTIFQQIEVYPSIKKEDEPKFHEWLRTTDRGDIIKSYVFPMTLKAVAKELIEQGEELPDWFKVLKVPTAKLRRK